MTKHCQHVAIVDDDESVRKALARLLSANSLEIDTYGSAQEFLVSLNTRVPDCLVVDLQMPDVSGLDLQRHLRRSGITIPTVMITAHYEPGLGDYCAAAGISALLGKPVHAPVLVDAIRTATAGATPRKAGKKKTKGHEVI